MRNKNTVYPFSLRTLHVALPCSNVKIVIPCRVSQWHSLVSLEQKARPRRQSVNTTWMFLVVVTLRFCLVAGQFSSEARKAMGGCVASVHSGEHGTAFSKSFCRIIRHYMPHFPFTEASTNDDRLVAFSHWEHVFKETIHSTALGANSPVGRLYENFYKQLFERAPHLKPLFQANSQVQSRVLVHISAGMKSLLQSDNLVQKVMELALLHLKIGVKPEDFDPLGETLMQAMKVTSGDQWSERIELAWRRIYCHAAILILVNIPNTNLDIKEFHDDD